MPYMDHFGIPFDTLDIGKEPIPQDLSQFNLIILSHKDLANGDENVNKAIRDKISSALKEGVGVVSFDPVLDPDSNHKVSDNVSADTLQFSKKEHYITSIHKAEEKLKLFGKLQMPALNSYQGEGLIFSDKQPLLYVRQVSAGRLAQWTSDEWMQLKVLGPLGGLDDCLWRSIVWAAKKPFVMRGLPPIVTMRVDDVAGSGERWNKSPLYWVNTANKYGLKPWLGLFIYNLNPTAVKELRGYLLDGKAVAFPHGFGRPMRAYNPPYGSKSQYIGQRPGQVQLSTGLYYYPKALPLRAKEDDEYIYFDHHNAKPWSDAEARRGLEAVDKWYEENKPLPKSKYFLAHWGELGSNTLDHIVNKWGIEFLSYKKPVDKPWADTILWVKQGPFRRYEKQGTSTNATAPGLMGGRPTYYADFFTVKGYTLFNCVTEIKDVAGYEWAPDNDVKATADRGIRMLSRALSSMAPAFLFTHETDFIYRITPENWDKELQLVTEGIKSFKPIFLTIDDGVRLVRTTKTSKIKNVEYGSDSNLTVSLTGKTDIPSYFYLFTEDNGGINHQLVEIPSFNDQTQVNAKF